MYSPNPIILHRYATVLVNFALNGGVGLRPGETVRLVVPECAKPLYIELRNQILRSGGHVIGSYLPDGVSREAYELSSLEQLRHFPTAYYEGLAASIDHTISILADSNLHELEGVDPKKVMLRGQTLKQFRDLLDKKENEGAYTWTLALYGTEAMAAEAGMSLEEYWKQIELACFLQETDPIETWKKTAREISRLCSALDGLAIQTLHIEGEDADLWIQLGNNRRWLGGSGRNIPSFEVFTSPDWRGTHGWIRFNQPLYRYGVKIEGIELKFESGTVVHAQARTNASMLTEMIATPHADKVGEFSLTDKRLSRISHFMANTLFDENISGEWGNTHIALGRAYTEAFTGNIAETQAETWAAMGFNDSSVHTDIVSTTDRTVTAQDRDGNTLILYKDGMFTI